MYSAGRQTELYERSKQLLAAPKIESSTAYAELVEALRFHEWRYYVLSDPLLSDSEYDELYQFLVQTERKHPDWVVPSSPSQRVASDLTEDFQTVKHFTPMLSLDNAHSPEDLRDFDRRLRKQLGYAEDDALPYCVEPKYDGGTVVLVYEKGTFSRAATRGNGQSGDEISNNVRTIRSIPIEVDAEAMGWETIELRGEALMSKEHFAMLNQQRVEQGQVPFANPRNASTGALRMKDPREAEARGLEMFVFQVSHIEGGLSPKSHTEALGLLDDLGFKTPREERRRCEGIEDVIAVCEEWGAKREAYPYEIDGMVIKADLIEHQEQAGSTSHHPRWAIAYKFKAKQATTKLLDIEYQVGKIGSITPVAKLDPVHLAGVTVSSVSLHNEDFITARDLHLGDTVLVERAGDVIPYIVKAFPEMRDGSEAKVEFPQTCPYSDDQVQLLREEDESAWRCPRCVCGRQDLQRMIFHVSRVAMDIDGLGKSLVERFFDLGWLEDISDIYNLDYGAIARLEGMGEKSAGKLRAAIDRAKENPIHRLLHSLSIHHLGARSSKLLAERIEHVLDLRDWSEEQMVAIKDIGPVVAKNVTEWYRNPENIAMLERMESYGVNVTPTEEDRPVTVAEDAPLTDQSILFTGSLEHMSRKQAQELAARSGAKNISAVSSKLDILVAGSKAGSKLAKATALGTVKILTEGEFYDLIGYEI